MESKKGWIWNRAVPQCGEPGFQCSTVGAPPKVCELLFIRRTMDDSDVIWTRYCRELTADNEELTVASLEMKMRIICEGL